LERNYQDIVASIIYCISEHYVVAGKLKFALNHDWTASVAQLDCAVYDPKTSGAAGELSRRIGGCLDGNVRDVGVAPARGHRRTVIG
jgi:hypothetical protein